ncbi:L,D-transpeptidase [Allosediminivita pacifica]|uniref:Lipoprotein-anchoring transpeptidase ErfK/SrfK n=1 Tax=Allosediminivita pacifica TaxID=1267769 RepID=A0A2T6B401_9RHOB|nr:L,D-transpeptidase [Allosediminivita pacifica]PTX50781.1 lipoprotein-anchoring transpeptidase ErfK/SrfK [Allosediminivita pacifica]GGB01096.1 carnitine operon oxidoreductase caia [Allosediminivita pacifica]
MIDRRTFFAAAAASLATPALAYELDPVFQPQTVGMKRDMEAGQILILPRAHLLYFITAPGEARRYGVGVGKAGLAFTGEAKIGAKKKWPTWRPTNEMIEREPQAYAEFVDNDYVQPGGPGNPLGARALYLFQNGRDTYFRIHGTTQPSSIGRSVSNGCIRMINDHVIDLYERVPVGAKVTVI